MGSKYGFQAQEVVSIHSIFLKINIQIRTGIRQKTVKRPIVNPAIKNNAAKSTLVEAL